MPSRVERKIAQSTPNIRKKLRTLHKKTHPRPRKSLRGWLFNIHCITPNNTIHATKKTQVVPLSLTREQFFSDMEKAIPEQEVLVAMALKLKETPHPYISNILSR